MTETNDDGLDWPLIMRKAAYLGRSIAREFPGVEASDIEQEIYAYVLKNKESIRTTVETAAGLEGVMRNAGRKYAASERYAYISYSAEWIYTPDEIRALFEEAYFASEMWEFTPQKDDGVSISAKNVVISLWDIDNAFTTLSARDQELIRKRYQFGIPLDSADRKALERAVDKVTVKVNGGMAAKTGTTTVDAFSV